jgi:uncharacterized SAM-binding protein YcdF (DUF218 family)
LEILLIRIIESLLMPPGLMIFMILIGILIMGRFFVTGKVLVIGGFALLIAVSLPIVSGNLLSLLEQYPPVDPDKLNGPQAIVILGGGRYADAPEYQHSDTVSQSTLERLRYGATLHRKTGLPILVSGGSPYKRATAEGELMRRVLVNDFKVPVKWTENSSKNTWENARNSHQQLARAGIRRIVLVTHAWHMPRAVQAFEQNGFEVIPAPTGYQTQSVPLLLEFVPDASAMEDSSRVLHELLGRIWYRIRY